MTTGIAAVTTIVSLVVMASGGVDSAALTMGFVPARVGGLLIEGAVPVLLTPLSATLIHAGLLHLGMNLLMLVFLGSQVERVVGGWALAFAYIVGAYVAVAAQYLVDPGTTMPMIGASGAISALFGIYAMTAARPKWVTQSVAINRAIHAIWLLAAWVAIQWMSQLLFSGQGMMIATPAHIGGFIAGLALQRPLLLWRYRKA